jgi:hypothetical protein
MVRRRGDSSEGSRSESCTKETRRVRSTTSDSSKEISNMEGRRGRSSQERRGRGRKENRRGSTNQERGGHGQIENRRGRRCMESTKGSSSIECRRASSSKESS